MCFPCVAAALIVKCLDQVGGVQGKDQVVSSRECKRLFSGITWGRGTQNLGSISPGTSRFLRKLVAQELWNHLCSSHEWSALWKCTQRS